MPKFAIKNLKKRDRRVSRFSAMGFVLIFWAMMLDMMTVIFWLFTLVTLGFTAPLQGIPPFLGMITLNIFQHVEINKDKSLGQKIKTWLKNFFFGWIPGYWTKKALMDLTK
ncbi:MAG: hypothetical protein WD712_01175 [Candidatus Spechtbacterales bacterium]